ncbi:MAG: hypothetical protein GY874_16240 [Desulfobacteraceae bacterium]|nr:hypothetical protein [Desulfobacteraceae bacterium]
MQKISGCFRKEQDARAYWRISSYLKTVSSHDVNPLVAIQMALAGSIPEQKTGTDSSYLCIENEPGAMLAILKHLCGKEKENALITYNIEHIMSTACRVKNNLNVNMYLTPLKDGYEANLNKLRAMALFYYNENGGDILNFFQSKKPELCCWTKSEKNKKQPHLFYIRKDTPIINKNNNSIISACPIARHTHRCPGWDKKRKTKPIRPLNAKALIQIETCLYNKPGALYYLLKNIKFEEKQCCSTK